MNLPTGTVTLMFTDVEGSTRLLAAVGDRYADLLDEHRQIVRASVAAGGGVEVDTQGDAFLVAFAAADAALVAAVDIQRTHAPHVWPSDAVLRVRIGLNEVRSCHVRADTLITTACGIGIRNLATAEWASLVGRQTAYAPSCP